MAFFFGDGFDLYSAITDCGSYWDAAFGGTATLALSSSGRFTGSRSIANTVTISTTPYITKVSANNDAVHHIAVAIQQTAALAGTTVGTYFTLFDGATVQCSVVFRSDGAILLTSAGPTGTTLATYTGAIAAINTWYQFEIEVVINNTTGSISVRKNGNTSNDFTLGSLNTRPGANSYANKIGVGSNWSTSAAQTIDDFLWRSDTSSVPWIGDVRCYTRMPLADSSVQFTRSGSVIPITPYFFNATQTPSVTTPRYVPVTMPCDGTIGTVSISLGAANAGNLKCTIFASSGSAPTTILGSATPLSAPTLGSNTFTFSTPVSVTKGTTYYVGFATDTAPANMWNVGIGAVALLASGSISYAAFPTANPAVSAVVPLIITVNVTATTNAAFVGELQQDAAASYVYSSTNGQADLYTIGSIANTPTTIIGVTTRGYMQKSDAGARNATVQLKSASTTVQGTSTALNTTWGWIARNDLTDPATGTAWTPTAVNNALIGPIVTV